MATLTGQSDGVQGQTFPLEEAETTIGRHDTNIIVIDDLSVSSFHCSVVRDGEKYTIHDLDSTNGVRVGGKKAVVRLLAPGDVVMVGSVQLLFEAEGAAGASASAAAPAAKPAAAAAPKPKTAAKAAPQVQSNASEAFKASSGKGKGLWIMIGVGALVAIAGVIGLIVILVGL